MYNIDGLIELLENKKTIENINKTRTIEQMLEANLAEDNEKIITLLNKNDIMSIFNCEDQKALRLMRLLHSMRFAIQIGREYYVRKERLIEFLTEMEGRKVVL